MVAFLEIIVEIIADQIALLKNIFLFNDLLQDQINIFKMSANKFFIAEKSEFLSCISPLLGVGKKFRAIFVCLI